MYGPFLYIFHTNGWWLTNHFILATASRRRALTFLLDQKSNKKIKAWT